MKRTILILSSVIGICAARHTMASDTLPDETIDNTPAIVQDSGVSQTEIELSEIDNNDTELLIPHESDTNLWTNDTVIADTASQQTILLNPMQNATDTMPMGAFSLGNQSYYGETVYIINNFLSGNIPNHSTARLVTGTCPFDTMSECQIWSRKPTISENVAPRSKTLLDSVMCDISNAIEENPDISANDKVMAPLLNRYRVLMRASQSCCTGGITYKLSQKGDSQNAIYRFLSKDANSANFNMRCLVMNNKQITNTKNPSVDAGIVTDVRNICLCKSKENFEALLAPFKQLYNDYPEFAKAKFEYKHRDGLGRVVMESINTDVQNVLNQLEKCP